MEDRTITQQQTETTSDDFPTYTKEELVKKLKSIFRNHIGRENPITRAKLYRRVFGRPELYEPYELWYNWNRIKMAMNWMRKSTKFFVVSRPHEKFKSVWEYYIVVDQNDADVYKGILRNTKRKIDFMLKRVDEAVQKGFWKDVRDGTD